MARNRRTLTLKLWTINARDGDTLIPYEALFSALASRDSSQTIQSISADLSFAIDLRQASVPDRASSPGSVFAGTIVAGAPEEVPIYFDYRTGETEAGATPDGKWLAQVSRVAISLTPQDRYLALETGRNGITAARLARYFQKLAEELLSVGPVEFDINPVQSQSLLTEIESFVRIREASAIVTRPNVDWNDWSNRLTNLAEESGGHEASATIRAARGDTLSKTDGIIGAIRSSLAGKASMNKFKITGRKENSDTDTVITSEKHQLRAFVSVPTTPGPEVDELAYNEAFELISDQRELDSSER